MKYDEYVQRAERASGLVDAGDHEGAITAFKDLIAADISDIDKAMMCCNLAVVYERMGRDGDALVWYGAGIDYETRHGRYYVAEQRASFYARQGKHRESLNEYRDILGRPCLAEQERERIRQTIGILEQKA